MGERTVTCPSGLKGVVRGLKGKEVDQFANKAKARRAKIADKVFASTWVKTIDPGPYTLQEDGTISWPGVLIADRTFLTLQIRMETYGSDHSFKMKCDDEDCARPFLWDLNVDDLEVRKIPKKSIERFIDSNVFPYTFESHAGEVTLSFKLGTGEDEMSATQARDLAPDNQASAALMKRTVSIVKKADGKAIDKRDFIEFFREMDAGDILDLIDAFDEHDGGVETTIDIYCPHCDNPMEGIELDLGPSFWNPKKQRRSEKKKARRQSQAS